tara:strand:+ start:163 stop:876 length:714 start_codon:yes stop_codon:yes gene_type:complete
MAAESANTVQTDGTSAVTSSSTKNDAGIIRHAGTIDSTQGAPGYTSKDIGTLSNASNVHGSTVASGTHTERASATRTVGFDINKGDAQVRMVGNVDYDSSSSNRNGFTVATVSSTAMRGGASDFGQRRNVHSIHAIRTVHNAEAIRDGLWNEYGIAGQRNNWESAPTANASGLWDGASGVAGHAQPASAGDDAAKSTLGQPDQSGGEITFHHGRLGKPTNSDDDSNLVYKAKHGTTS